MWTVLQKVKLVLWYAKFKSVLAVQCKRHMLQLRKWAPDDKAEIQWIPWPA